MEYRVKVTVLILTALQFGDLLISHLPEEVQQ